MLYCVLTYVRKDDLRDYVSIRHLTALGPLKKNLNILFLYTF